MKICPFCGTKIPYNDNYCFSCQRTFEVPEPEKSSHPRLDLSKDEWRKPWLSAAMSAAGVGLGQLYNGEAIKGLVFISLFLGALLGLPLYTTIDPLLIVPVIWAGAILDAYLSAGKINQLQKEFRKKSIWFWPEVAVLAFLAGFMVMMLVAPHLAAHSISLTAGAVADTKYPIYATPLYDKAVSLAPDDTGLRMDRVRFMHSLGHDTDARQDLEKIMIMDPNDTAPIMMTGNLLYDQAEYEESIVYFEKALSINQNDAHIWLRKGDADLEISIKEMQKIREKYRTLTANSLYSSPSSDASTMDAFRSTEHYRDAMESYNKAIKIDPFMSVTISSHILASTQTLLNAYEGILDDMGSGNSTIS